MNRKNPLHSKQTISEMPVPLEFDRSWLTQLESRLDKGGPWGDYRLFQLGIQAEETNLIPNFDEIQCLKHLQGLTPLPHQMDTARKVLFEMSGRAILADEVGLGKTIEAALSSKNIWFVVLYPKCLSLSLPHLYCNGYES